MFEAIEAVLDVVATATDSRFDRANWWLSLMLVLGVVWFAAFSISPGAVTLIAWPGAGIAVLALILVLLRAFKARRDSA